MVGAMLRTLTVVIPDESATKLGKLAERAFRRPKDQASLLLVQAIEEAARSEAEPALLRRAARVAR